MLSMNDIKDIQKYIADNNITSDIENEPRLIDYVDVLVAKKPFVTEQQKKAIEGIRQICKEKQLKFLVVDSEATIKNKRVIWKVDGA